MTKSQSLVARPKVGHILAIAMLVVELAYGQTGHDPSQQSASADDLAHARQAVKSGNFAEVHVDLLVRAGVAEAIPIMREQYTRTQDSLLKAKLAAGLLRLGDAKDTYWDFLVQLATPAIDNDAPNFMTYDSHGKSLPGPSPEFTVWARAHNVPPNGPEGTAAEDSIYMSPAKVAHLAWSKDSRAIPLLRRALLSPNHMIVIVAAEGLAEIQDKDSIPLIVEACRRAPADAASLMAEGLVYFDDAEAQRAVDLYVSKDKARALRLEKDRGKKAPWD